MWPLVPGQPFRQVLYTEEARDERVRKAAVRTIDGKLFFCLYDLDGREHLYPLQTRLPATQPATRATDALP